MRKTLSDDCPELLTQRLKDHVHGLAGVVVSERLIVGTHGKRKGHRLFAGGYARFWLFLVTFR